MHAPARQPVAADPWRRWRACAVGLAVLAFLALALAKLRLPGLYYDEALFVNAALGGEDDTFLRARWFGIPVAMTPYLGALKSWLHAPVFWLFGVSVDTVRLPSVLLAAATLLWLWRLGARLVGPGIAAVLALVLATDPAFVLQARLDYGPTVLMLLAKTAALSFLVRWLAEPRARLLWGLVLCLALGLFDKLNFVWFVAALGGAVLFVWPRALARALAATGKWGVPPLACLALVLVETAAKARWLLRREDPYDDIGLLDSALARVPWMLDLWHVTATGDAYHGFVFAEPIPSPSWALPALAAGLLAFAAARLRRTAPAGGGHGLPCPALFFLVLLALLFALMVATPQARGGHHALVAWPFHWLFAAGAVAGLRGRSSPRGRRWVGVAAAALAAALVASQLRASLAFVRRLDDTAAYRAVWSPAIHELAARLAAADTGTFAAIEWGLHTPLFALAQPELRRRHVDLWQAFFDVARGTLPAEELHARHFRGRDVTAVLFTPEHAPRASMRAEFLRFADRHLERLAEPELVRDAAGRALYEIHRVRG